MKNLKLLFIFILILLVLLLPYSCSHNPTENDHNSPCPPIDIVPDVAYDSPIWHPGGQFIGFNHTPLKSITYPYGEECVGEQDFEYDSSGFWLVNSDGTNMRRIFSYTLQSPAWSPDGEWISFCLPIGEEVHIFKMRFTGTTFDTSSAVQLTSAGRNFFPDWSPDGQWIAYDRSLADESGPAGVWIMKNDGFQKKVVANGRFPDWSPTMQYIVFTGFHNEIYRVNINDTSDVKRLTSLNQSNIYATDNRYPHYSFDGTKIAFVSSPSPTGANIWIMNSNGSNLHQITANGVDGNFGISFSWSPTGEQIVYTHYQTTDWTMNNGVFWMMNLISGNKTQFTFNP
jgi:TolB protein